MKINKKDLIITIFIVFIIGIFLFIIYGELGNSLANNTLMPWIIGLIFISILLILRLFINVNEEKANNVKKKIAGIAVVAFIIAGGNILGFELHTIWEYLIAFVLLYIFYEYVLVKIYSWIRKKTMSLHIKVEHNVSKRLKKRYQDSDNT